MPAVPYVDPKLVTELKLKMTDLQCSRLHYGTKRLHGLGKISTSVQCIFNGMVAGNLHIKASVVENLYENCDAHSITGSKLTKLMSSPADKTLYTTKEEPMTPKRPKKKKKIDHSPSFNSDSPPSLIRNITSPMKNPAEELPSPGSQCVRAWAIKRAEIDSRKSTASTTLLV
jgi:hypothetical protein